MLALDAQQSNDSVLIQCVSSKQASVGALKDISEGALQGVLSAQAKTVHNMSCVRSMWHFLVFEFTNDAQKCLSSTASTGADGSNATQMRIFQIRAEISTQLKRIQVWPARRVIHLTLLIPQWNRARRVSTLPETSPFSKYCVTVQSFMTL